MSIINNSKTIFGIYNQLILGGSSNMDIMQDSLKLLSPNSTEASLNKVIYEKFCVTGNADFIGLIELIGLAHQKEKENVSISNTDERKHNGIYYTDYSIAELITKETLSLFKKDIDLSCLYFLEPCSGIGIFGIAYLDVIFRTDNKYIAFAQDIVDRMFFADIDEEAIKLLKQIIPAYLKKVYSVDIVLNDSNLYVGDALLENAEGIIRKNDLTKIFARENGFDVIITNPPYKLLKANSNKYDNESSNYKDQLDLILSFIRKNKTYKYNSGTLNLYKLFVEEIVEKLTNETSKIGLLIPSTLLSDKHSFELRNLILNNYFISTIHTIPEKNDFFNDISQAFCFFSIDKANKQETISLKTDVSRSEQFSKTNITIHKSLIKSISTLQEIVSTDELGWKILSKIHKHKKIKDLPSITNFRGELDLSLDKRFITEEKTGNFLLRGNGVKEYVYIPDSSYVKDEFFQKINSKKQYVQSDRIVCQQISNIGLSKRLKFSKVPPNIILGNSCNFISIRNNGLLDENNISLDYLLGILNSFLLNWRFQQTNSNNHIGNYELDELPIAVPDIHQRKDVEVCVAKILCNPGDIKNKVLLNKLTFDIYGLDYEESMYILNKCGGNEVSKAIINELSLS